MANTRAINRKAEGYFASKRQRLNTRGSYHDRLVLPDDFLDVYSRDAHVTLARKILVETPRSTLRGQTAWRGGHDWEPEDDREIGLVDAADWEDAYDSPATQDSTFPTTKAKQKGRKPLVSNTSAACRLMS